MWSDIGWLIGLKGLWVNISHQLPHQPLFAWEWNREEISLLAASGKHRTNTSKCMIGKQEWKSTELGTGCWWGPCPKELTRFGNSQDPGMAPMGYRHQRARCNCYKGLSTTGWTDTDPPDSNHSLFASLSRSLLLLWWMVWWYGKLVGRLLQGGAQEPDEDGALASVKDQDCFDAQSEEQPSEDEHVESEVYTTTRPICN